MQTAQKTLRRVNIFSPDTAESGYIGKKTAPKLLGFVYAQVMPAEEKLSDERGGKRVGRNATLILRKDAGVKCGDFAGVYGDAPDSRICGISRCSGHITARTELL